ncbi:hypothetical protein BLX88_01330, partial [Bacillus obstructivus]
WLPRRWNSTLFGNLWEPLVTPKMEFYSVREPLGAIGYPEDGITVFWVNGFWGVGGSIINIHVTFKNLSGGGGPGGSKIFKKNLSGAFAFVGFWFYFFIRKRAGWGKGVGFGGGGLFKKKKKRFVFKTKKFKTDIQFKIVKIQKMFL